MASQQKPLYSAMLVLMEYLAKDSSVESAILMTTILFIMIQDLILVTIIAASSTSAANH